MCLAIAVFSPPHIRLGYIQLPCTFGGSKYSLHLLINHLLLPQSRHPNSFLDLNSKALSQSMKQPQRLQAIS